MFTEYRAKNPPPPAGDERRGEMMITNERLKFWANSIARNGDTDTAEKIAMARELLDRRGKGDVVTYWRGLCDETLLRKRVNGLIVECIDRGNVREPHMSEMYLCDKANEEITAAEYEAAKNPTERSEIEPWLCLPSESLTRNEVDAMFQQLQRRLEAVERRGK